MRKIVKGVIGILLITIIILTSNLYYVIGASESELNSQKSDNDQKIKEAEQKKEELQDVKDETMNEINSLSEQITNYQSQINNIEAQIDDANKKIEEQTQKLAQAEEDYKEQEEMLNERVVALYELGEVSYLDVLLSSESLTDFISRYYVISEIAESDVELLDQIENQKKEIEDTKKSIEDTKAELSSAKEEKEKVAAELQNTKNEKDTYVAELSQDQQELQEQIEELQEANIQIDKDIAAARAEAQRKLQEELERQKQQQQNQNNNTGNNGSTGSSGNGGGISNPSSSGFIYPVPSAYSRITTGMYYSSGAYHGAVDFGSGGIAGQPVYAVADGIVVTAKALTTSYGNYIIIMHDNGLYTLYAHGQAGSIMVSQYQRVKQGQQIMKVGNTGNSFGAHLHFEVRTSPGLYSNRVNPIGYLP